MDTQHILRAIEEHAEASGLRVTTICQYAVANRHFYENLRAGRDYQVGTAARLLAWLDNAKAKAAPKPPAGQLGLSDMPKDAGSA